MQLRQPAELGKAGITYSACGPFTKNKERIQKIKETRIHDIFIKINLINQLSS